MERVLSLNEAARGANISLSTLKRLIAAGVIRKVRVSEKRVGVLESEFDDYLRRQASVGAK